MEIQDQLRICIAISILHTLVLFLVTKKWTRREKCLRKRNGSLVMPIQNESTEGVIRGKESVLEP